MPEMLRISVVKETWTDFWLEERLSSPISSLLSKQDMLRKTESNKRKNALGSPSSLAFSFRVCRGRSATSASPGFPN